MNFRVLKEPRGFMVVVKFILSIFAFATTGGWESKLSFDVKCLGPAKTVSITEVISYPFNLNDISLRIPVCHNATTPQSTETNFIYGDMKPSAEFYVFVGVVAFLFCMGSFVLYVFFDEIYRKHTFMPLVDFVVNAVFVLLWLISSAAWAAGLTNLKDNTRLADFKSAIPDCVTYTCSSTADPDFASLNVSIIFGFLCMGVWAGSLWFLWKETSWFKQGAAPPPDTIKQPDDDFPTQPTPQI